MNKKKAALAKTIAILLSVTPETPLGKFLRLCLETKVDLEIAGETPLEIAREFIDRPFFYLIGQKKSFVLMEKLKMENGKQWMN